MPRYDYDNEFEGPDPHSTAGRPDDNSGQQIPPTVRVDHFIDVAAECSAGEDEWDSQDGGTPVEQVEDETDVAMDCGGPQSGKGGLGSMEGQRRPTRNRCLGMCQKSGWRTIHDVGIWYVSITY
jgi:hypothetical protein